MDLITVTAHVPAGETRWRPGDAWLAGGTWLFSEPQPDVTRLLDLTAFAWPALVPSPDGLAIAATCTLAELAAWTPPENWPAWPLARGCCDALLASFKVWNTATVGGNLCLALPAGAMTSFTAALDGVCTIWSADGRERPVPAADFVTAPRRTVLGPGELLRSVHLPIAALRSPVAVRRIALSEHGRSAVLVIGRRDGAEVVLTITAATPRPVRFRVPVEAGERPVLDALAAAAPAWYDDVHGDPRWRRAMTRRFVVEIVAELARAA